MTPNHTRRTGRLYRYYVTTSVLKLGPETCPIRRIPAAEIEDAVIQQIRGMLRAPEVIARIRAAANGSGKPVSEADVRDALIRFDPLWAELFPAEQARIVRLLVERVDVRLDGAAIRLRTNGLASLMTEMRTVHNSDARDANSVGRRPRPDATACEGTSP